MRGWQDGSVGKDTAAKPEELILVDYQDPNDGREKTTLSNAL